MGTIDVKMIFGHYLCSCDDVVYNTIQYNAMINVRYNGMVNASMHTQVQTGAHHTMQWCKCEHDIAPPSRYKQVRIALGGLLGEALVCQEQQATGTPPWC